ncbi:MAG: hypothetical protein NTX05_06960 [Fusobacteria bacterium]|nr:hypothetical protein [Fusobacteriota bacterium]
MREFNFYDEKIKLTGNVLEIRKYEYEQIRNKGNTSLWSDRYIIDSNENTKFILDTYSGNQFYSIRELQDHFNRLGDYSSYNNNLLLKLKYALLTDIQKQLVNKVKSIFRVKEKMIDIINSNLPLDDMRLFKVLTLTYSEEQKDLKQSNEQLKNFIKRFNYKFMKNENLKYIAIKEYQKNGNIHFHIVLFNAPYIKKEKMIDIDECWGLGMTNYQVIKDVDNIGLYIAKIMDYIFKEPQKMLEKITDDTLQDEEILQIMESNKIVFEKNHKFYQCSRGLKRGIIKYVDKNSDDIKYIETMIKEDNPLIETFEEITVERVILPPLEGENEIVRFNTGKVIIKRIVFKHKDERLKILLEFLKKL